MELVPFVRPRLPDTTGLKTDDFPISLWVAHVDVGVAIVADYPSLRGSGLNIG